MRGRLLGALRVVISVSLIGGLFWMMRGDFGTIMKTIASLNRMYFLASVVLFVVSIMVAALRLRLIASGQGCSLTRQEAFALTFLGYFFNNFLPTSIGGDLVKGYYTSKKMDGMAAGFSTVFIDRFVGLLSIFFIACISLLFMHGKIDPLVYWTVIGAFAVSVLCVALLLHPAVARWLARFGAGTGPRTILRRLASLYQLVHGYRDRGDILAKSVLYSCAGQMICFVAMYFASLSISAGISLGWIIMLMPLIVAVSMLPSLGGLGVREGAIVLFMGPLSGHEKAFALSVLWLVLLFVASVIGGLIYLFSTSYKTAIVAERKTA